MKKKALFILLILVFMLIGTAYLTFDYIIKHGIETIGSRVLNAKISVGNVKTSAFLDDLNIENLSIANPSGYENNYAFEAKNIHVKLNTRSLFTNLIIIHKIEISSPIFTYELGFNTNKVDNIGVLKKNAANSEKRNSNSQKKIILKSFVVKNSKVTVKIPNFTGGSFEIPNIEIKNIGARENGIYIEKATEQVLTVIQYDILKLDVLRTLVPQIVKQTIETAEDLPGVIGKQLGSVGSSLNKILKGN